MLWNAAKTQVFSQFDKFDKKKIKFQSQDFESSLLEVLTICISTLSPKREND